MTSNQLDAILSKYNIDVRGVIRTGSSDNAIRVSGADNVFVLDLHNGKAESQLHFLTGVSGMDMVVCANSPGPGDPLFDTLDLLFFDQGLVRVETATGETGSAVTAYLRSSLVRDLSQLRQPKRHVVSMPTIGENGRFANQIFQAILLSLYGLRSNCEVTVPPFEAGDVFSFPFEPSKAAPFPRLNFGNNHGDADLIFEAKYPPRDVELWGYFQHITRAHRTHKDLILRMLRPKPAIENAFGVWFADVRSKFKRVFALHIRRGDYSPYDGKSWDKFTQTPIEWYLDWLENHAAMELGDGLLLSTDEPGLKRHFSRFPLVHDAAPLPPDLDPRFADLLGLSASDVSLYINSSWSFAAALMAAPGQKSFIVDFEKKTFAPFDPWESRDFWLPFDSAHRDIFDMPFRTSGREAAEQKLLDRWRAQAELAFMAKYPLRFAAKSALRRLKGSRMLKTMATRLGEDRFRHLIEENEKALSRRRQMRALIKGRGRITNKSLDVI